MKGKLTVYKASAGSGKTYTLAYEYIKMLLGVKNSDGRYVLNSRRYLPDGGVRSRAHSHILAITFTNKATAEMKERIVKELYALTFVPKGGGKDAAYAEGLMREFGCTRTELQRAAGVALQQLMFDYGQFNVSTIDSFFQTILRNFARELDRQGDYRIELDDKVVLSEALSMFFDEVNYGASDDPSPEEKREHDAIKAWLTSMASDRVSEGKDFNPFNRTAGMYTDLVTNLGKIFSEKFISHQSEMLDYVSDSARVEAFEAWLKNAIDKCKNREAAIVKAKPSLKDAVSNFQKHIALYDKDPHLVVLTNKTKTIEYLRNREPDKLFKKAAPPEAEEAYFDWFAELESVVAEHLLYSEMLTKINTLRALMYVYKYIERYRRENNLILLSDTNSLLGSIIADGDDTPFIYERVGMQLSHFLIDEFQDTSRLQWRNLRPLVANGLDNHADSLIIGDVKQSIYSWRGGDSELLNTRVEYHDFPAFASSKGQNPGENTNYRSAHTIVRFNNTLFAALAAQKNVSGYLGVEQSLSPTLADMPGKVTFLNLNAKDKNPRACADILVDTGRWTPEQVMEMETNDMSFHIMALDIERQVAAGYRYSDIAILCRRRVDTYKVATFLLQNYPEIKIVSDDALLLANSQSVKLIVSILEILDRSLGAPTDSPADVSATADHSASSRNRTRRRQMLLTDTFNYHLAHGMSVDEALSLAIKASDNIDSPTAGESGTLAELTELRTLAPASLPALIEAIIDRKITPEQRAQELPYISAFIDLASSYCSTHVPSVHSFISYWNEVKDKAAVPGGANTDAVTIITVHKAKGLEWPCLHIPLMNWAAMGDAEEQWFDLDQMKDIPDEICPPMMYLRPNKTSHLTPLQSQINAQIVSSAADCLNVAYVAFTRAVRELRVHMTPSKSEDKSMRSAILDATPTTDYINTPSTDVYVDPDSMIFENDRLVLGEDTVPLARRPRSEVHSPTPDTPRPEMRISFNALNAPMTRLEDLTTQSTVTDDVLADDITAGREIVDEVEKPEVSAEMAAAARRGTLMHAILAEMYTEADLDRAVDLQRQVATADELQQCRATLREAFEECEECVHRWFSPDVYRVINEQPIYNSVDSSQRRADRIVWLDPHTIEVVDYKFTTAPRDSHVAQVREYAGMLSDIYRTRVTAHLWYPVLGKVIHVD